MCHVPRAPYKEFVGGAKENIVHIDKASGTSQAVAPPWRQKARDKETRDKRATYSVTDKSDRHWAGKMRVLHGVDLKQDELLDKEVIRPSKATAWCDKNYHIDYSVLHGRQNEERLKKDKRHGIYSNYTDSKC